MDYSKLSDFEINEVVSMALLSQSKNPESKYVAIGNYCNSWADAGPIIVANRITLMPASTGDKWMAQAFEYAIADVSINPLRAAMIVYLMMQEGE